MNGNGGFLQMTIQSLAAQSPVLLVYFLGLIIAIAKYGKHPKPAMLVILAMIGFLLAAFFGTALTNYLMAEGKLGGPLTAVGILSSLLRAGALVLLVSAAFAHRTAKQPRYDDDDDDRDDDRPRPVAQPRRSYD